MTALAPQDGLLDLRFAKGAAGRTELVHRAQRFPLHFTVPLYIDPLRPDMPFVYIQNPTGGVFGGDILSTRIAGGDATAVHVTTTAATKIYRSETAAARQRTVLDVGPGAYLEHIPEPLIPQAGSSYDQETVVELADGARVVLAEIVAPGRLARGERFAYDRLRLATTIRSAGSGVCRDAIVLEPSRRLPAERGLLGRYPYFATLFAVAPSSDVTDLVERLDAGVRGLPGAFAGAAALPSQAGAFVRVLAESPQSAWHAIGEAWRVARQLLLGEKPPLRRRK